MFEKCVLRLVVFLFLISFLSSSSHAQRKPVLSGTVDDSARVTMEGSKHPLAQPRFDVGPVDPTTRFNRMLLVLAPSPQQEQDLQTLLDSQQDKSSPNYHHWLTPQEFGQKFGPAPQDLATVKSWLVQQGFSVDAVAQSGRWIQFSGTAGQAERAFGTIMRQYQIGDARHIANATQLSLPAGIAPVVSGVASLHNFFMKPMVSRVMQASSNGDGTYSIINPDATFSTSSGPVHALTPGDYTKIYQLQPLYSATPTALNGAGTTIAIVARSDANFTDVANFRSLTGIVPGQLINTLADLPDPGFNSATAESVEADLDAEWAGAIAPGATINMVVSASTATTDGVDLAAAYIVDHDLAPVMNVSFGDCEASLGAAENAFFNGLWQQAAAQGISVMVSSGDSGAAGCDLSVQPAAATHGLAVSGIASTPFNTAVGGTQFQESGKDATFWSSANSSTGVSVNGYIPEVGWNESCDPTAANSPCASVGLFLLGSTGGGSSSIYSKPSWQNGIPGMPPDLTRDVPDLSLSAAGHDGYVICFNLSCLSQQVAIIGGTSASSPSFAGMVAIVNQALGRQGLANYKLYELAQKPNAFCNSAARVDPSVPPPSTCLFNDVIFGSNGVPGQGGFLAGPSYDRVTGLGSVNASNLVNAWKAISLAGSSLLIQSAGTDSIVAVHGQPVPLTATVSSLSGGSSPTGGVALSSSVSGAVGAVTISPASTAVSTFDGSISNLPGGTYTLTGHYSGDGLFAPSDSNPVSVTITPEPSTISLRAFGISSTGQPVAAASFPYGSFMDLHADFAGASGQGTATGTITFADPATLQGLGAAAINLKNEAEFILPGGANNFPAALSIGTHTISATYGGDSSFNGSSAQLTLTVTKGNPAVDAATFSDSSFVATQPGRLDARVIPSGNIAPTGTVQYFDGGTPLGTPVQLNGNQAPFSATFDSQGQHSITASYSGDATYNAAVSQPFVPNVVAPFVITVPPGTTTSATISAGQSTVFTLNLSTTNSSSTFSGTVALTCATSEPAITCSPNVGSISLSPTNIRPQFTLTVTPGASASLHGKPFLRWPGALAGVVAVVLAGFGKKSNFGPKSKTALGVVAITLVLGIVSCGGGGGASTPPLPPPPPPPTHATVTVTGTSGTFVNTLPLNLTITH